MKNLWTIAAILGGIVIGGLGVFLWMMVQFFEAFAH